MKQPLVSVVVPAFNRAQTVPAAVRSVLRQQYDPLEVIVVDDGSADGTAEVARAGGDPRVRVIANARAKGAQGARNTGILAARGEWIAFNDSDDEWLPGKLAMQLAVLRAEDFAKDLVVHGDVLKVDARQAARERFALPHTHGRSYASLLRRPGPMLQAMLAHRESFERIGLLDEAISAYHEWDTAIRLAEHCRFVHLREPLLCYSVGGTGTISADARRDVLGYAQVVRKHGADIARIHGRAGLRRHLQWLVRRAVSLGVPDLAAALRAEAVELGGVRRALLERSCVPGALGELSHRLAQLYDLAASTSRAS